MAEMASKMGISSTNVASSSAGQPQLRKPRQSLNAIRQSSLNPNGASGNPTDTSSNPLAASQNPPSPTGSIFYGQPQQQQFQYVPANQRQGFQPQQQPLQPPRSVQPQGSSAQGLGRFQIPGLNGNFQIALMDPDQWMRAQRATTVDSNRTGGSGGGGGGGLRIKKDDIGQFNPHGDDPLDEGVVSAGKDTMYTDVDCFIDRIETFREDPDTIDQADKQLMQIFQTLLAGPASNW